MRPCSIEEVVSAVKKAESENLKVRAVGSGHSFSTVAKIPDGNILLDMCKMDDYAKYSCYKVEHEELNLMEVGAGLTIKEMNKRLDKDDLAILNMGGIDHQTISGAISTGTHGTGIELPALPGLVESILIVTKGGEIKRIEKSNGITDPSMHKNSKIELVQDDETFHSLQVGLGLFGIIVSFVIRTEKMYWMIETKEVSNWQEIKPKLIDQSIHKVDPETVNQLKKQLASKRQSLDNVSIELRGIAIQVSPFSSKEKKNRASVKNEVLIIKHYKISEPVIRRSLSELTRNILPWLGNNILVFSILKSKMRRKPHKLGNLYSTAIHAQKDKVYVNKAPKVMYQGLDYIKERAYDSEFAFDLSTDKYIQAMDKLIEEAQVLIKKDRLKYLPSQFGMRFVAKSKAFMSPEYERSVCYIDTPFLTGKNQSPEKNIQLNKYQNIMLAYDGIPHWGKVNFVLQDHTEKIEKYYPKLTEWKSKMLEFNPSGTFCNKFSEQLKFDQKNKKDYTV